jgi:transposase
LQPRHADTTEVIGVALAHKASGLGFRRIADLIDRAESTVRRWLRRATPQHVTWACHQGATRLIQLAPEAFNAIQCANDQLRYTLTMLSAAAYWDRLRCGCTDPPWTLIGIYTRGRLLAPRQNH